MLPTYTWVIQLGFLMHLPASMITSFFLKGIFESHGQNKYITLLVFFAVLLAMIPLAGSVKGVKSSWNGVRSVINTSGPELSHEL